MVNLAEKIISLLMCVIMILNSGAADEKDFSDRKVEEDAPIMQLSEERKADRSELEKHYNEMALKLLRESLNDSGNTMISPESVLFALTMAAIGANGETYEQMTDVICPGATKADLNDFANRLIESLNRNETIHVANSVWINKDCVSRYGISVNEAYLNLLRKNFNANASVLPFDDAALKTINGWISDETEGMIKDMLKNFSENSFMLLINAMSFDGTWEKEYTQSQIINGAIFTDKYGKETEHKALKSTEGKYLKALDATGFLKNYAGGRYAFLAMLPDDSSISLADYIASLPDDAFTQFYNSRKSMDVIARIPCFSFDYEIEMKDVLKKLGMKKAFDEEGAEFFDMLKEGTCNPSETQIWIERVLHKTHIELDENGTQAAASTVVEMGLRVTSIGPVEEPACVILDRPFVFAIMDLEAGIPVFVGTVENP